MSTRKVYENSDSAVHQLQRCGVLEAIVEGKIYLRSLVGIRAWGAIDYLINRCKGFSVWTISKNPSKS